MTESTELPPHGGHAPPIMCSRLLHWPDEGSRCPNDATHHVMWNEKGDNGLVCSTHRLEAVQRWQPMAVHKYEMECSMPGALFVHAENRCIVDEDWLGLPTKQEQFAHGVMDRLAALEQANG